MDFHCYVSLAEGTFKYWKVVFLVAFQNFGSPDTSCLSKIKIITTDGQHPAAILVGISFYTLEKSTKKSFCCLFTSTMI